MSQTRESVAVAAAHEASMIELAAANIKSGQASGVLDDRLDADLVAAAVIGALRATVVSSVVSSTRARDELIDMTWEIMERVLGVVDPPP